ncbi:MAG: CCA tRNA nucleotidyltransferase [Gemmatimonadetes bacterium]|nr:CCA tRNA nucleotidyltransferase [Gemmatimonadota bacterium]MYD26224.1 CCA tRNA nucleotidyltransferase [Gemmatimonadota bacterium]MYI99448.1 CCA tRNA nucleotidyltransferase [Gemmatimonadota bacterium]
MATGCPGPCCAGSPCGGRLPLRPHDPTPFEYPMSAFVDPVQPLLKAHRRLASDLADLCREVNHEVYLVGGSVRDAVLGRTVRDLDLTLAADGLALGRKLADRLRCPFVPLDDTDRTGRVVLRRRFTIDISSFKGDSLEADLRKRDFTINAMAVRLADLLDGRPSIIDPLGGASDLAAGKLKAVSEASFRDDPLRVLRAFRLAGQFGLDITPRTETWIAACDEDLREVSGERLLYELSLIMGRRRTSDRVSAMIRSGVFASLFPGWMGTSSASVSHRLERTDRLIARDVCMEDQGLYTHLTGYEAKMAGDRTSLWILRFASLVLCGIRAGGAAGGADGAPDRIEGATVTTEPALDRVEGAADRLRLSKRERQALHQLVFGALRLLEGTAPGEPDDEALCRILRGSKYDTPGAALLAIAHGPDEGSAAGGRIAKAARRLLRLYTRHRNLRAKGLILNGADIMDDLGLTEGPEVGRLLDKLETIQTIHDIRTREQARKLLYEDAADGLAGAESA